MVCFWWLAQSAFFGTQDHQLKVIVPLNSELGLLTSMFIQENALQACPQTSLVRDIFSNKS